MLSMQGVHGSVSESGLRIEQIRMTPMHVPLPRPFHAAVSVIGSVDPVLVTVLDRDGCEGFGIAFAFGRADAEAIHTILRKLADLLGQGALSGVRAAYERMERSLEFVGAGGPALAAMGAMDLALWDLLGRRAGIPLWQMLGGSRSAAPAYASCGSLDLGLSELVEEVGSLVDSGHRSIKIKSRGDTREDCQRLRALRHDFGTGLRIALDANQALAPKAAIRWAAEVTEHELWWIEEPVRASDHEAHCQVRHAVACDLASGENLYGAPSAHEAIRRGAVDILMPNLQRLGGLTPWLAVAAHAGVEGIRIGAHVHPEYQIHAMCGLSSTVAVECWPGWPWIWEQPLTIRDGLIEAPVQPGIGLTPDPHFIRKHQA